jgi:hypothetical protein
MILQPLADTGRSQITSCRDENCRASCRISGEFREARDVPSGDIYVTPDAMIKWRRRPDFLGSGQLWAILGFVLGDIRVLGET